MKKMQPYSSIALLCAALPLTAGEGSAPKDQAGKNPIRSLALLAKEKHPEIDHVEVKGENPKLIYIPILHDNPEHRHAAGDTNRIIEESLVRCQQIAEHLFASYGVINVLLEGLPKSLSDKYNAPEYRARKLSVGESQSIVYKVWYDLLNKHPWHLVPAYEKKLFGPLTLLGADYTRRIQKALQTAQENGWFRSNETFLGNKDAFTRLIEKAAEGYNERREALLKEDPGLRREYDITVVQRNRVFIDNMLAAEGPGIIMCGGGHIQDLIDQLEKRGISYMIVVPKGMAWPPKIKDGEAIYRDMLKLGCQLTTCTLTFGDGKGAEIRIPIKN